MRSTILAAALGVSAQAQTTTILALMELFNNSANIMNSFEFWEYFLLGLQFNTSDTASDCITEFQHWNTLYDEVAAKTASPSATYGYEEGIATKGNGQTGGTTVGFYIYSVQEWAEVVVAASELWHNCHVDLYLSSVGKSVTSVAGFLNQAANFGFRYTSGDDSDIYSAISTCSIVGSEDPAVCGENFGIWIKALLMVENESQEGASEYYKDVGFV